MDLGQISEKNKIFLCSKEMQNTEENMWQNLWITCCQISGILCTVKKSLADSARGMVLFSYEKHGYGTSGVFS